MAELSKRMKGMGRVTFIAHRDKIAAELAAGWPMKAVHEKLADKLGISYPQFARYVYALVRPPGQSAANRPLSKARSTEPQPSALIPSPKPLPQQNQEGQLAHARHQPAARPTFTHHGIVQEGEAERLLGPSFIRKPGS